MITLTEVILLQDLSDKVKSNEISKEDAFESCIPVLAKVETRVKDAADLLQIAILRSYDILEYLKKVLDLIASEVKDVDGTSSNNFSHPWLSKDNRKPKVVYEALQKFQSTYEDGNFADLDSTEVALMLSSVITHVLLDVSRNGTDHETVLTYGLTELSDSISSLIYSGFEITDYTDIYNLLLKYKYLP